MKKFLIPQKTELCAIIDETAEKGATSVADTEDRESSIDTERLFQS